MRSTLFFAALSLLTVSSFTASAQSAAGASRPATTSSRLAMASTDEIAAVPASSTTETRVACTRLDGQVLGADAKPLIGATVTVKGTPHLYITNSEGRYLIEVPVYQGQVLEIEAAGYTTREVLLADCTAPTVNLDMAAGTRVKKKGKRAGQIVRFGTADLQ